VGARMTWTRKTSENIKHMASAIELRLVPAVLNFPTYGYLCFLVKITLWALILGFLNQY